MSEGTGRVFGVTARVRFAPSPTGFLHLGSARTALFNWLYARSTGAEFVLRIEDTDTERSKPELIQMIFDSLDWLGLDWDNRGAEMYQSSRRQAHLDAVAELLAAGRAYRCDCSQDDVKARNAAAGRPPGYDGFCRDRGLGEGPGTVVRFRVPDAGSVGWTDLIRGEVVFENRNLEDFVLARSDGSPVFLIANAVDDAAQGITLVIRGEDLVNVTPKVLLLREALSLPGELTFAHVPLIVNAQRKKLSKRRDDVALEEYRSRGYLPEAMVNYLALLGWGPPDGVEVRPVSELAAPGFFRIEDVNPSPAAFDPKKLDHVNGEHIRMLSLDEFLDRSAPFLAAEPWGDAVDQVVLRGIGPEVQTRVRTLSEVPAMVDFFFVDAPEMDADAVAATVATESGRAVLSAVQSEFVGVEWTAAALHACVAGVGEQFGLKLGKAQAPVRVAVTGRRVGPPLFESLELLGRDRTLERVGAALAT